MLIRAAELFESLRSILLLSLFLYFTHFIEVLQILSKNRRDKENENETSNQETNNKDDRQLQHKYWIEEHVYEYIKSATPCGNANPKRMPELVRVLKQGNVVGEMKRSTTAVKEEEGINGYTSHEDVISSYQGFGLSDAELQILNWMPKEMVEFHLIIEDLSSRLPEEQQMGLIEVIHKYATPLEEDNNSNNEITLHTR